MLADTSDIHAFGLAQRIHADDLATAAAELTAAQMSADDFGPVGAGFLAALNDALAQEARLANQLAERLAVATSSTGAVADAYDSAEVHVGQSISVSGF